MALLTPSASIGWAGPASIGVLTAWAVIQYDPMRLGQLPLLPVWALAIAAFFTGFGAIHLERGRRRAAAVALPLLAVALLLGILVATGASPLRLAAVGSLALGSAVAGGWARARWIATPSVTLVLAVQVVSLWMLLDTALLLSGVGLYDLRVYLAAGAQFADGQNPYLTAPLTELSPDPAEAGFVYPPVLLPLFALLAQLPAPMVVIGWVALLLGSALLAFRALGAGWGWAFVLLAFPPLVKGVTSGNVANVILLLLCAGPLVGGLLPSTVFLKIHAAIPSLWLVRERRWRDALIGGLVVAGVCLLTLPVVGLDSWGDWLVGLELRAQSQENLPILYGLSLAQWLPLAVFLATSAAAVVVALLPSGRRGLAALGLASIVASPSLWPHGFLVALPAVLFLDAAWLWLALGVGVGGAWLWVLPVAGALALVRPDRGPTAPGPWGLRAGRHTDDAVVRPV